MRLFKGEPLSRNTLRNLPAKMNALQMSTRTKSFEYFSFKSRSIWFTIKFSIKGKLPKKVTREHTQGQDTERTCLKFKKLCYCLANIHYSNYPHFVARHRRKKKKNLKIMFADKRLWKLIHFCGHYAKSKGTVQIALTAACCGLAAVYIKYCHANPPFTILQLTLHRVVVISLNWRAKLHRR